ncbi:hypothetical protein IRJ41_012801 [Triplophysa rosa]|uniref:FISNA domain-containing protein n=1 Tax=Triplophysa rosa TaxID=992332 RepID=A0A9W7TBZ0_TRIRA|nr:hypothetical protein IRJ41_012801 [Triplophysa rosa]
MSPIEQNVFEFEVRFPAPVLILSDWSVRYPHLPRSRYPLGKTVINDSKRGLGDTRHEQRLKQELERKIISLMKNELKNIKRVLSSDYPACSEREEEEEDDRSGVREELLKITLHVLRKMKRTDLGDKLLSKFAPLWMKKHKDRLKEKCQQIHEGISHQGHSSLVNEIYTELYITEGGSGEVNNEHEVRQIEMTSRRPETQETPIKCNDIFKALPGQTNPSELC